MKKNGLYLQLFSIHGLIRGNSPELGRDADTGGQVKYVLELAQTLAQRDDVAQVDLVTRLIRDKTVAEDYARPVEQLSDKARIIRIQCGGYKYRRKELLWPFTEEFIDKTIRFLKSQGRTPDLVHGHYADAGYVAMELAAALDVPFVFTGHSLGRNKKAKLLAEGLSEARINKQYHMDTRIQVEEKIIQRADLIVTSTRQEVDKQYGLYNNFSRGRYVLLPPGIDLNVFFPYYDLQFDPEMLSEETKQARVTLESELHRFWSHPEKPFILTLCRPDHRKNIAGLLSAYGTDKELQAIANLAVFAGIRHNIITMEENEQEVLTDMLLKMDRYDLYGKLAIPKKHDFATEVPALYRLCAEGRGVFVNPALIEPFGLTLVEASACGLPIVATNDGGPVDIIANCNNGILVDARQPEEIGQAVKSILIDQQRWEEFSKNGINGVREHYCWPSHCEKFMHHLAEILPGLKDRSDSQGKTLAAAAPRTSFGKRLIGIERLMVTDIDNTLIGDDDSLHRLLQILQEQHDNIAWGVSTGRSLEMTLEAMTRYNIPVPDVIICSVGTEIYYGPDLRIDKGWQRHISHQWKPEGIKENLDRLDFLTFQEAEGQRSHKISYYMREDSALLARVHQVLQEARLRCRVVFSHGQFLDILPYRASKGRAIKYLSYKYEFPPQHIMVAGDSGNDEDMLRGQTCGLVVGNYSEELEKLKGKPKIFFSKNCYAAGIIDGLYHYRFILNP
ncbi:mannosylfructose-phosphate synthase [bacterium BMS3Bbin14]|nr:mannosylfructose-phosphate synthase [bacterium BMS3Abin13]GBE52468.1 mannosylfructose-phosphate synthase [bacterium BMS3Bbin14]